MYTNGQIITKQEHVAFANWNNKNGGKFRSESMGNGTYKIVEVVIPEPTEYEQMQERIVRLKQALADSDYKVIKCVEAQMAGVELPYNITELHAERQELRDMINELEFTVDNGTIYVQDIVYTKDYMNDQTRT